jgi:hypothetical protein
VIEIKIDLTQICDVPHMEINYDDESDDIRSLLDDTCGILADTELAEFKTSGFGQESWPVDVRTDFSVFLEQLPAAIASVAAESDFEIDFYEQGIERTIRFSRRGSQYVARCESRTTWTPNPETEMIDVLVLHRMLCDVRAHFLKFLERFLPEVAIHPWMLDWSKTKV